MTNELENTWNDISTHWDDWKAPLRPSTIDTFIIKEKLENNTFANPAKVFLLGVTPELVTMDFGFPTYIEAMDRSQAMIDNVWPGDVDGYRKAILGDWSRFAPLGRTYDLVLADGSLVFFSPTKAEGLVMAIRRMLKTEGKFVFRNFIQPTEKETISSIVKEFKDGYVSNFHSFKFRVAMALQKDFKTGVTQAEVYDRIQAILPLNPDHGFSENDLGTLNFYQNKKARHHFPTIQELTSILDKWFANTEVTYPAYEFGNCCPIISCSGSK